jgi:tetratricopeptide (TPR) repeat protein
VDDLAKRFAPKFAVEPGLLYTLANAYAMQGLKDKAEETASRAFQLNPGKQVEQVYHHLRVAQQLRDQGLFAWARREYEYVLTQTGEDQIDLMVIVRTLLAEMLHDQGQDLAAADTLQKLVDALDSGKMSPARFPGRGPHEIRARTFYFTACHWEAKNDLAKQREFLDKALAADPEDLDALIACYHLSGQTPEYHAKLVDSIKKTADKLRNDIVANPEDAASCNQYAWLVGNTEGNFDEAIKCSQKSLELQPDEGGYYDTLAHAYFGKGDLENAVKTQTKAAELEPHSGLIQRKLEFFRKKLEEKKKAGNPGKT